MKKMFMIFAGIGLAVASARAGHQRLTPEAEARSLAFELQDQTWDLLAKADRSLHYRSPRDGRALEDMRVLKSEATRLSRKFDRDPFNNYGIDRQLRRVDNAIERATFSARGIRGKTSLRHRLREIERTFIDLVEARRVMLARLEQRRPRNPRVSIHADLGRVLEAVLHRGSDRHQSRRTRVAVHID